MKHGSVYNIFFASILLITNANAEIKNIGLPFTTNYPREVYSAGTQNWAITQDNHGFMYFANNNGVLRYDGNSWNIYALPNESIVRSVAFFQNRIFAGGFNEFGFFQYDDRGELQYKSLSDMLKSAEKNIGEVWRIYSTRYGVVFQSFNGLYVFNEGEVSEISPISRFGFSYYVNNKLIVVDRETGIYVLLRNKLEPLYVDKSFFSENEIFFILPDERDNYLVGTSNKGVYKLWGDKFEPWDTKINQELKYNQIYTGIKLGTDLLAVGTIRNGVYLINTKGDIIQHVNRFKGLQNNTVLSLFSDKEENLWLGLDNGIDYLEISNPITRVNYTFNIETTYSSIVFNGILYVGTNQGLFACDIEKFYNNSQGNDFTLIDGTQGQVWSLKNVDGSLICGHNIGLFQITGYRARKISSLSGVWDLIEIPNSKRFFIAGTYDGLVLFEKSNNGVLMELGAISGFEESCREIEFDDKGYLWMTHGYKGLYRLELSANYREVINMELYDNDHGLPLKPYTLSRVKDEFCVVTTNGIYKYYHKKNSFALNERVNELVKNHSGLIKIEEDYLGDIWYYAEDGMGVNRLQEDGSYSEIVIPFQRINGQFLSYAFANVYTYDKNNVFIGGIKGLLHYNPNHRKDYKEKYQTYVKSVKVSKSVIDSTIIEFKMNNIDRFVLAFRLRDVSISYVSPTYEAAGQVHYSQRLRGFEYAWSEWGCRTQRDYTNLSEGDYIFEVRAKDVYGNISETATLEFSILPPFYRTTVAYVVYVLIMLLTIVLNVNFFKKRIEKTKAHEKQKHEEELQAKERVYREEALMSEQEIERLKNEKLQSEMRYKDMELANSTMNIIKKNKFLREVKDEIHELIAKLTLEQNKYALRQIVKRIDKDINSKQYWKVFDKYFDEVHEDFMKRLKEKHTELTPKDLRLCAYLKMNISTKEIAPLMNISVRGVEISRYRLRKKLELDKETNLTEYILGI